MLIKFNQFLDKLSDYFAHRKGLMPMVGVALILLNLIVQFLPGQGWLVNSDLLLHLGVILAIVGFMIAWAL